MIVLLTKNVRLRLAAVILSPESRHGFKALRADDE